MGVCTPISLPTCPRDRDPNFTPKHGVSRPLGGASATCLVSVLLPTSRPRNLANMQPRIRFNARARQSSHKKKAKRGKDRPHEEDEHLNPNAPIVTPKSEAEKAQEKKLRMREEVRLHLPSTYLRSHGSVHSYLRSPTPRRIARKRRG